MKMWRKFSRTCVKVAMNMSRAVASISRIAVWSEFRASAGRALVREEVVPLDLVVMLLDRQRVDGT
jgi:hypothetical protein